MANQVIDPSIQYTEGDTDATVTGTAVLWEDTGDTLRAVSAAKPLPVTATDLTTIAGAVKAEDSAHASGDAGVMALGVRQDSATVFAAVGDYIPMGLNRAGGVYADLSIGFQANAGAGAAGTSPIRLEDDAHASGDAGIHILAVRNDTNAATGLTSLNGDYSPISVDSNGRVITADCKQEDAAHTSVDIGSFILGVQNTNATSLSNTEGDYTPFATNSKGSLYVDIDIDNITGGQATSILKAEDSAHASGDAGVMMLAVKNESLVSYGAEGDYSPISVGDRGGVFSQLDYRFQSSVASGILKLEDSVHASGDAGVMNLGVAVNPASPTTFCAVGDYVPAARSTNGAAICDINYYSQSDSRYGILKEVDSAHVASSSGVMAIAVRKATPVDTTTTDGDYEPLQVSAGRLWTSATVTNTVTTTGTATITKTALTPSSPTFATVGVASASALAANASRKGLVLTNTSSATISLGLGAAAVLNSGITLTPYGVWVMDEYTFCTSQVFAIASAAASNLAIQEFA